MNFNRIKTVLLVLIFFSFFSIESKDWDDLNEGEKAKVYGSEKSKKYSASNIFWEVERWDNHYGVRILHLYDYTNYPKYNSTQFFPFYYRINSKLDNREKFRFLNYTTKKEYSETDNSIFPIIYWGNDTKSNYSYKIILPFYSISNTKNPVIEKTNLILFPLTYYYSYKSETNATFFQENHYSILYGRVLEKYRSNEKIRESSFWFPILPLVRYSKYEDYYFHFFIPIYGYSRKENSTEEKTKFAFSLFPFYYSKASYPIAEKNRHYKITHWTLFHYRSVEEDKGGFNEFTHKSKWGFPVLPLLFYSSYEQGEGNYKRLLTLFHWESAEDGKMSSFSFLPFVFYKKEDYFRIPILLIDKDLSSPKSTYGRTFMPLLLYYNNWDAASQTFVLGPWISNSSSAKKESFKTLFPVYWKSKSEKRELTLILPFYANYNDKEDDYNFNLLWFTRSSSGAVNPKLSIGKKEDKWYFDTDLTILYYLASISFRQTLEKPKFLRNVLNRNKSYEEIEEEKLKEEAQTKNELKEKQKEINPKLSRKKSVSREDSYNFRGYSLLFGVLSYEAADSRRHFRLLPLSWLSWDTESSDKVLVAPLFLWYQTEALEYFVLFPIYGKQKDEESEKKAVLLNLYISETYKENNWKEKSILWPLSNLYSSDKKSGHRVLPFYIHQKVKGTNSETNTNYTLFSYYSKFKSNETSNTKFFFWPLLSYYKSYRYLDSNNQDSEQEFRTDSTLWVTPFIYRSKTKWGNHTNLFWFIDWEINPENNITKEEENSKKLKRLIVFPFYYYSDGNFGLFPLSFTKINGKFETFTLFNYFKKSENYFYYNFLFLVEVEKSKEIFETNLLLQGFNLKKSESAFAFDGLWEYGWNFAKDKEGWQEASILWYLGGGYRKEYKADIYNLSLLLYHESGEDYYKNWTLGNFRRKSKDGLRNNFLYLVDYESFAANDTYTWDFIFTGIRYHNLKQENYFQGGHGFIWNFKKEKDIWSDASFLWLGYSRSKEEITYNFIPIIRTYDSKEEHTRIYGPALLYTSEEKGKNFHLGLLGLGYWHNRNDRKQEEDTYILLGALYREYKEKERGFRAKGSLWGWLWEYQKEEETSFEKFSVLKLFSYTKEADGTRKILGVSF